MAQVKENDAKKKVGECAESSNKQSFKGYRFGKSGHLNINCQTKLKDSNMVESNALT